MTYSVADRELMFRNLAGNPTARHVAERALQIEDEEEAKRKENPELYPWMGFEWHAIPAQPAQLNQLAIDELLVTGGGRNTYRSRSTSTYKLKEPELVRECLKQLGEIEEGQEETEIPPDLFDFILGHEQLKDLIWKSLNAERPVHILMVGPPASAKSMFLGELARLPFSRFTLGGGTSKAGLADFLLEFRPRYLIIDEIDKMPMTEQSILLSLMESGIVARLKKRMREIETMTTTLFAAANRDNTMWPELKSRFFSVHLKEYSEADFISIARAVLITREKVEPGLATLIAGLLSHNTRDVREAIHFGRLCKTEEDVRSLLKLKYPSRGLF